MFLLGFLPVLLNQNISGVMIPWHAKAKMTMPDFVCENAIGSHALLKFERTDTPCFRIFVLCKSEENWIYCVFVFSGRFILSGGLTIGSRKGDDQ
jgi:hypothetical protein